MKWGSAEAGIPASSKGVLRLEISRRSKSFRSQNGSHLDYVGFALRRIEIFELSARRFANPHPIRDANLTESLAAPILSGFCLWLLRIDGHIKNVCTPERQNPC